MALLDFEKKMYTAQDFWLKKSLLSIFFVNFENKNDKTIKNAEEIR